MQIRKVFIIKFIYDWVANNIHITAINWLTFDCI